jgi:antitoxin VapB
MPISIKNEQTEALVRSLAALSGESITEAIGTAVAERYDRLSRAKQGRSLADDLNEIGRQCSSLPDLAEVTDDQILGYK